MNSTGNVLKMDFSNTKGAQAARFFIPEQEEDWGAAIEGQVSTQSAFSAPWKHPFYLGDNGVWYVKSTGISKNHAVSRWYVRFLLDKEIALLPMDEQESLINPLMSHLVRERFEVDHHLTLEEVEEMASSVVKAGGNPLPQLQRMLEGLCDVAYQVSEEIPEKSTLICQKEDDGRVHLRSIMAGQDRNPMPSSRV